MTSWKRAVGWMSVLASGLVAVGCAGHDDGAVTGGQALSNGPDVVPTPTADAGSGTETPSGEPPNAPSDPAVAKLHGLVGVWKVKTQSGDASCGPNANATVAIEKVAEAEWDTPGDIAPPGGVAFFVSVSCSTGEGNVQPYGKPAPNGPVGDLAIVPPDASTPLCRFGGSTEDLDKVDYDVQYCGKAITGDNAIATTISTLRRAEASSDPPADPSSGYAPDASAPACSASLQLSGSELAYVYDCGGVSAKYTFTKAP